MSSMGFGFRPCRRTVLWADENLTMGTNCRRTVQGAACPEGGFLGGGGGGGAPPHCPTVAIDPALYAPGLIL